MFISVSAVCQESFHHGRLQRHDAQVPELRQGSGKWFPILVMTEPGAIMACSEFNVMAPALWLM